MISQLRRARKHYLCSCCHQLILPGELYRFQSWAPWEQEYGTHYWRDHACRWCADRYWKAAHAHDGLWAPEQDADEWRESELRYWLTRAEADFLEPGGSPWYASVQKAFRQPWEAAADRACRIWNQHYGMPVLLAFFVAVGLDPWELHPQWGPCGGERTVAMVARGAEVTIHLRPTPGAFLKACGLQQGSEARWAVLNPHNRCQCYLYPMGERCTYCAETEYGL